MPQSNKWRRENDIISTKGVSEVATDVIQKGVAVCACLLLPLICATSYGACTVVDLFAGVGGLSYGLAQHPGFDVVLANEIDEDIAKAYELNHTNVVMLTCGIEELTGPLLERSLNGRVVDLIVGGPPCQSYSTAGKRQMDARANLFKEYKRVLVLLRPKAFIFENVRGLLSMEDGQLLKRIKEEFEEVGYDVKYKLLDAANYGVPQHRERVIIVGMRGKNNFEYPAATHGAESGLLPMVTLKDALSDLPRIGPGESATAYVSPPQNWYQELMRKDAGDVLTEYSSPKSGDRIVKIMKMLKEGEDKTDLPVDIRPKAGFANTYGKLWWDKPSGTITRNFATPSSARCIHPIDSRALSIREGARFQSFPDNYQFYGSDEKKRIEIGNAVPPILAKALAEPILKALTSMAP